MTGFRLLWAGETTSFLGSAVGGVALPLVALGVVHASVFLISSLTAAAWLPSCWSWRWRAVPRRCSSRPRSARCSRRC